MTIQTSGNYEQGYRAVLVREDIATAALEMAIEDASSSEQARERLFARVKDVVRRDLDDSQAA